MNFGGIFRGLADKYKRFMYGRYGQDGLNLFISALALVLCVVSFIIRSMYISVAILLLFAVSIFRSFSKNFTARRRENRLYEKASAPVRRYVKYWRVRIKSGKTHRVYSCEKCHSILRVPKSTPRGRIEVKCPKCGDTFTRRLSGSADKPAK